MISNLVVSRFVGRNEHKHDPVLANHVLGYLPAARFQSLVRKIFETHPGGVVAGGLLGIADVKGNVVEAQELAAVRLGALVGVGGHNN